MRRQYDRGTGAGTDRVVVQPRCHYDWTAAKVSRSSPSVNVELQ